MSKYIHNPLFITRNSSGTGSVHLSIELRFGLSIAKPVASLVPRILLHNMNPAARQCEARSNLAIQQVLFITINLTALTIHYSLFTTHKQTKYTIHKLFRASH